MLLKPSTSFISSSSPSRGVVLPLSGFSRSRLLPRLILPVVALSLYLAGTLAHANTISTFLTTGTDLSLAAGYNPNINPAAAGTTDVQLTGSYSAGTTFTANGSALLFGTLDDLDTTQSLVITNAGPTPESITLNSAANTTAGAAAADLIYVQSGANLTFQNTPGGGIGLNANVSGNFDDAGTLNINDTLTIAAGKVLSFTGSGATTVNGNIAATTGAVTINAAAGTVVFGGSNNYTGATTITTGTLQMANAGALASSQVTLGAANDLTFKAGAGGTYTPQTGSSIPSAFYVGGLNGAGNEALVDTGGNAVNLVTGGNTSYTGVLSGSGGLIKTGTGTFTILSNGANAGQTYTGPTIVDGGVLALGDPNGTGATNDTAILPNSAVTINSGGTFVIFNGLGTGSNNGTKFVVAGGFNLNGGNIIENRYKSGTIAGARLTNGMTVQSGANTVTLNDDTTSAQDEYLYAINGTFTRNVGSTVLFRGDGLGQTSASAVPNTHIAFGAAGTYTPANTNGVVIGAFYASGNGTAGTTPASTLDATDIASYNNTNLTVGSIGSPIGFIAVTSSTQAAVSGFTGSAATNYKFTGAIGLTSAAAVNSVNLGAGSSIDGAQTLSVTSGVILDTVSSDIGGTTPGTLSFSGSEAVVYVDGLTGAGQTLTIGDQINGASGLTFTGGINGAGTLVLSNTGNSYTGSTIINSGTLQLGNGTAGFDGNIGGPTVVNNGSLLFNFAGANTYSGVISGTGSVIMSGTGSQNLANTNTYTGPTIIRSGSLLVSGSLSGSSPVTIRNIGTGANLGGGGLVGPVIVGASGADTGSNLQPNAGLANPATGTTLGTGSLTFFDSAVTLTLSIGRNGAYTAATGINGLTGGDISDHVSAAGAITLNGASLNLSLLNTGYRIAQGDIFYLIINGSGSAINGTFGQVNGDGLAATQGSQFTLNGVTYQITYQANYANNSFFGGNDVALEALNAAIPEPGTWAMLLGGAVILVLVRRRHLAV